MVYERKMDTQILILLNNLDPNSTFYNWELFEQFYNNNNNLYFESIKLSTEQLKTIQERCLYLVHEIFLGNASYKPIKTEAIMRKMVK